jgi:hypothetical protein
MTPRLRPADLRPIQRLWAILIGSTVLSVVMLLGLYLRSAPLVPEVKEATFYTNALLNFAAVAGSMWAQQHAVRRIEEAQTPQGAFVAARMGGLTALLLLEISALVAGAAALVGGEAINFAFVVPYVIYAVAFFPTPLRLQTMLAVREGASR